MGKDKGKEAIVAVSTNAEAPRDVRETIRSTILSLRSEYNENGPVVLCSFAILRRVVFLSSPEKLEVAPFVQATFRFRIHGGRCKLMPAPCTV